MLRASEVIVAFGLLMLIAVPNVSGDLGFGLTYYGSPNRNPEVRRGTQENISFVAFNRCGENFYISIEEPTVYDDDGEPTPDNWWDFEVYPRPENFEFWTGTKEKHLTANFLLPTTTAENEMPDKPYPKNFDAVNVLSENGNKIYVFSRWIRTTVSPNENVPPGTYDLHVPLSGKTGLKTTGAFKFVFPRRAEMGFRVTSEEPPEEEGPSPLSIPIWMTALLIAIVAVLVIGLLMVVRKKDVKI